MAAGTTADDRHADRSMAMREIEHRQFERIAQLARRRWGLNLTPRKLPLVTNRLASFVRASSSFPDVDAYLDHLDRSAGEEDLLVFFDILSTNVTSFFRDPAHFEFLERELWTPLSRGALTLPGRRVCLWSAGCSTGCEPYSMAISALESLSPMDAWDVRILATDLSNSAVAAARRGIYAADELESLPPDIVRRWFRPIGRGGTGSAWEVVPRVRSLVSIARLNLMDAWPMRGPFDVIFCRNVMIYFDAPEREHLVSRFCSMLRPGGIIAVGSAETLAGLHPSLRQAQASIFRT